MGKTCKRGWRSEKLDQWAIAEAVLNQTHILHPKRKKPKLSSVTYYLVYKGTLTAVIAVRGCQCMHALRLYP